MGVSVNSTAPQRAGVVSLTASSQACLSPLGLGQVRLGDGYWKRWRDLNRSVTIPLGPERLEEAGSLHDLRLAAGLAAGSDTGPLYRDSDVYKWLEAVAWERGRQDDPGLARSHQEMTGLIAAAQQADGYLNSYYQARPELGRFSNLATGHELYCAGHLIQAAIAAHRATGDDGLLTVAVRFADHLCEVFGPGRLEGVPGHPEIEMALTELHRLTGDSRYLALARYFIDARGHGLTGAHEFGPAYFQDRVPVREATSVEGHAVRALYLAAGATDVAIETGDTALLEALERQWADMVATRTYLTGGLGSRWEGEAFGEARELPDDRAYCETCAAIASVMWSWRLLLATGNGRYADLIERTLFNATVPGLSLDGDRFFYVNPLRLRRGDDQMSSRSPGRGRQPWYDTACCPTNLMRLLASVEQYFWTRSAAGVQLHQFAAGEVTTEHGEGTIGLTVATRYPWDGRVEIGVSSSVPSPWTLSVRIPAWCNELTVSVNGATRQVPRPLSGYLETGRTWAAGDRVVIDVPMPVRRTMAAGDIDSARGRVALERGPLVYCVEEHDCPGGTTLDRLRITGGDVRAGTPEEALGGAIPLEVPVVFAEPDGTAAFPYAQQVPPERYGPPARVKAVPYYAWANRGVGPMRVWLPRAEPAEPGKSVAGTSGAARSDSSFN
jgi:DUF1680 family protein